jgi:hypothetical protein
MRVATVAVTGFFVLLVPGTALAQGRLPPGVHVSPGSPTQHQYVIPVTAARAEANGGHRGSGSGSGSQLFGNGIKPGLSSSSSSSGGSATQNAKAKAKAKALAAKPTKKGLHTPSYALASSGRPPSGPGSAGSGDGGGGWVPLVAGGALVLVLGCGGGFALRRRVLRT